MGAMVVLFLLFIVVNAARAGRNLQENIRLRIKAVEQEQVLRNSEARLNQAQHSAHIGNWELELASNKLYWSDEIYRIFEIDKAAFGASYEAFLNAIHPDDRDMVNKAYTDSLATSPALRYRSSPAVCGRTYQVRSRTLRDTLRCRRKGDPLTGHGTRYHQPKNTGERNSGTTK